MIKSNKMKINPTSKNLLSISSLLMAIAIIIGAFGAHGLKPYLDEYGLSIYEKASNYQFYNTLGLFIISLISIYIDTVKIKISYYLVLVGMIIFSFSLYTLALSKIMWLGAITPIGGLLMIVGWFVLAYGIKYSKSNLNELYEEFKISNGITYDKLLLEQKNKDDLLKELFTLNKVSQDEIKEYRGIFIYNFFKSFDELLHTTFKNANSQLQETNFEKYIYNKERCIQWAKTKSDKKEALDFGTFYKINNDFLLFIFMGHEYMHYGLVAHSNYQVKDITQDKDNIFQSLNLEHREWEWIKWYSHNFLLVDNLNIFTDYANSDFKKEFDEFIVVLKKNN